MKETQELMFDKITEKDDAASDEELKQNDYKFDSPNFVGKRSTEVKKAEMDSFDKLAMSPISSKGSDEKP